jgi:integrase
VVAPTALRPVVGQVQHRFTSASTARDFARACNVIVATPNALDASEPEVRLALLGACSHLFIDEAHHVAAATWQQIRDEFAGKPVIQFTATPFREDGRHIGGRLVYAFPLREAQKQGYFSKIKYHSIVDFEDPDRAIALRAIDELRKDVAAGRDHLLMARVPLFWWDHMSTLLGTGLRFGELAGLRRRRVHLSGELPVLEVGPTRYEAGRFGSGFKPRPKSDAGIRQVPLAPLVVEAIRRQLPPGSDPDALVFTGPGGGAGVPRGTRTVLSRHNLHRT